MQNRPLSPPPQELSIVQKLSEVYKIWQEFLPHTPQTLRNTLCVRIDFLLCNALENAFGVKYASPAEKLNFIKEAINNLDKAKFFLRLGWEVKLLTNKKYIALSVPLDDAGRMLNAWQKQTETRR